MRTRITTLCLMLLLVIPAVSVAQVDTDAYSNLARFVSTGGFPALGDADAPVSLLVLCDYGSPACADFEQDVVPALLPYVAAGEAHYIYLPLTGMGTLPNGRGAARAALCAAELDSFWTLHAALFAATFSSDAPFEPSALRALADDAALDTDIWQECLLSDRPDTLLDAASRYATSQITFDGATLPYVQVNGVASLPDAASIEAAVVQERTRAEATPDPEATEPPLVITVEPLLGERIPPPLTLDIPDGWRFGYDTLILSDADSAIRSIPLAVFTGPVPGGEGTIILLWGFPNLFGADMFSGGSIAPDLWSDGLRLLRLAIIEQGCNIGTDLRRTYSVGGQPAPGTQFSAVDCPELPDTRGWFAGVQHQGVNFVFYAYAEPIEAMMTGQAALQTILDSVVFTFPATAEATATPEP